ncbi:SWI/SNF complex 60 kDa subunit, partial [Thamnocephalis sphaerospora]
RKRKPIERQLPAHVSSRDQIVPESQMYTQLQSAERRLDALIMRKRLDIQDAANKPVTVKRTLRIFVSNLASDQPAQLGDQDMPDADDSAALGQTIKAPSWTLRVEGRLLDDDQPMVGGKRPPPRAFSTFVKKMVIELDRDPALYPDGNFVEWNAPVGANAREVDGFEVKRLGDAECHAKIAIHLVQSRDRFKLAEPLAELLGVDVASRIEVVVALWEYIKLNNLADADEKRRITNDDALQKIFGVPVMMFPRIPELLAPLLLPLDPVVIEYTIRVDKHYHQSPFAYDVEIEVPDEAGRQRLRTLLVNTAAQKDIAALDEQITQHIQAINNAKVKRDFLREFSTSPSEFVHRWIASQNRDLEVVLGESHVNLEERRRADFFKKPWVQEAITHYLGARLSTPGPQHG